MPPPSPTKLRQATKTFVNNSGLLMLGTLIALVWANVERESYVRFAHSLHFIVNDIGMAFFFALAAKEVAEATAPGGALHSPRRAAMPLAAAVGGMLGPGADFRDADDRARPAESRARLGDSHGHRHRVQLPRGAHHLRREASRHPVSAAAGDCR